MSLMPLSSRPDYLQGTAGMLIVAAAVFVLVAGIGAAASLWGDPPAATSSRNAASSLPARSGVDGDLARLKDYTRSIEAKEPVSKVAAGDLLPDVNTMIERLAARLEGAPQDIKGWQMLGWSYLNTGQYQQAASAYARAAALDPSSAEIKRSYEEAKAKASGGGNSETVSPSHSDAVGKAADGSTVETATKFEAGPPHESNAAIRSMVDGLANRLEKSPRDAEGWTRLMRSRVVLGERDVAVTAFRKALEVFNDDAAVSDRIKAAAIALGLKAE